MKQDDGNQENHEILANEQITDAQRCFEVTVRVALLATTSQFMIYFSRIDEIDDRGARDREEADQIEDPIVAEGVTQRSRHSGSDEVTPVVETFVTADPCIEAYVANKTKTERRERRRNDGGSRAQHHLRSHNGCKLRMECD